MRWAHLHRFAAAKKSVEVISRDEVAYKGARHHLRARKSDRARDVVASFSRDGSERWRRELRPMHLAALGDDCVLCDDSARSFVVLREEGEERQRVPMFEPSKIAWATLLSLPSGAEWLAIGNHGEWDHYGDASLASEPS